jgi:hypothetical protein
MIRMRDSETPQRIVNYNPEGSRKVVRLTVTWIYIVNNSTAKVGVGNSRTEAKDRDGW